MPVQRRSVDFSAHPDLVVIYLGMRVNVLTGLKTLFGMGPQIEPSHKAKPDGLLLKFAPAVDAHGSMFSARRRLKTSGVTVTGEEPAVVIPEADLS